MIREKTDISIVFLSAMYIMIFFIQYIKYKPIIEVPFMQLYYI